MNSQIKKFWTITSCVLFLMIIFVPYEDEMCFKTGCMITESGYAFVGNLGWGQSINIPLLLIEMSVVLIIAGSYYYFAIKDK